MRHFQQDRPVALNRAGSNSALGRVVGIADYIDLVKWRRSDRLSPDEYARLKRNCHHRFERDGSGRKPPYARQQFSSPRHPETRKPLLKKPWLVTAVMPMDSVLEWYGDDDHALGFAEIARDLITPTIADARDLLVFFDRYFVQLHHKGHHQHYESHGSYTKLGQQDGIWFCYYVGHSKLTDLPCLHVEMRVSGRRALDQLGLRNTADLIDLIRNADAFWQKHMIFADVDVGRYGRWLANRRIGSRRQKLTARDYRLGGHMLRKYGAPREFEAYYNQITRDVPGKRVHFDHPPEHEERTPPSITMQQMIDKYGSSAPFIRVVRGPINTALQELFEDPLVALALNGSMDCHE